MITQEQIKFKKGKIGASQVAAALGISPFQTPANLAMELLGRIPPPEENEAMRIGNIMEPAIAQIYMDREEMIIHPWEETCVHPHFDWLIAHPDYFYNDENEIKPICLIEIKNVGFTQILSVIGCIFRLFTAFLLMIAPYPCEIFKFTQLLGFPIPLLFRAFQGTL